MQHRNDWDDLADEARPAGRTALIWGAVFLCVLALLSVLAVYLRTAVNQAEYSTRPYDPAVLAPEAQRATEEWAGLLAQADAVREAETAVIDFERLYGVDQGKWPQGKREEFQQLQAQARNARSAYRTSCAQYEARWLNEWRAVIAPDSLPRQCPDEG